MFLWIEHPQHFGSQNVMPGKARTRGGKGQSLPISRDLALKADGGRRWRLSKPSLEDNIQVLGRNARAVLIFVFGYLLICFSGRRTFGSWSSLDIVISITVGSNLSRALTGPAPLLGTMAATALLMAMHWMLAKLSAYSETASQIVEGSPVELGGPGGVNDRLMKAWSISKTDLFEAMRESKVKSFAELHSVMLEPSGKIHVTRAED